MFNKNERMAKLNGMGIETGKYFSVDLPNGLKPGAKIALVINENGEPVVVADNNIAMTENNIANQIIADGYVRNTKLHRRFVMAQMFEMLNYQSWNGHESGYTACLKNRYGYDYTLKMMLEEVKVLSKLEARDKESFDERSTFFTKKVIIAVMEDYMEKLKKHVDNLPNYKCKGVPYKKIKGINIFNDDLYKKLYAPLYNEINYIKYAKNYTDIHIRLQRFVGKMVKLPYNTPKSKEWIDAFKGEGAYYTLKNLVMFHGCGIKVDKFDAKFGAEAMVVLQYKLNEYRGEGWRMFALLKKVISDNGFDFNQRMHEIYGK